MTQPQETWSSWLQKQEAPELVPIPRELDQSAWQPSDADRNAAWVLFTEIRTRIATQPLHYRSGDEETALDSLYKLFGITRDAIKNGGPDCRHFATITTVVLNTHIRPLTARWHKMKVEGRLLNDDDRREFRRELNQLRGKLMVFCRLLGRLSATDTDFRDDETCGRLEQPPRSGALDAEIPFDGQSLASELYDAELSAIRARRDQQGDVTNLVGLACSGGGIRSATFCLGVVQAMCRKGILPEVDYVSTVSGGGYFGSFLSSYLNDPDHGKVGLESGKLPFEEADHVEPSPMRMLRNNSKYLLKGGLLGQARVAGLLFFGILVNLVALLPVLFGALTVSLFIEQLGITGQSIQQVVKLTAEGLIVVLALLLLGLPIVYRWRAAKSDYVIGYERAAIIMVMLAIAVWMLGLVMPQVYQGLRYFLGSPQGVIVFFLTLPFVLAGAAFVLGPERVSGRVLIVLAGLAGPLLLVMTFFALDDAIHASWGAIALLLSISFLLIVWLSIINVNHISPHRYYRNRLAETYLLRRAEGGTMTVDPQLLSKLRSENPKAPYHLINAAVNLPASRQAELRGRRSDFFLFSQDFCGSPLLGYCPTVTMEEKDPNLDLGTAMAISGAAASSFMGTKTISGLTFWLSLLNVRLAYWLPNPAKVDCVANGAGVRPLALWRELFGKLDENGKFVNLSDGGHIENLGIQELLRRRCKFIVAIDGEADPGMAFPSLMQLIRYAQIDFGIRIRMDLTDLAKNEAGYSKAHFVLGEIDYGPEQTGYLLYIKSSLTGNERDYVLDYQQRNRSFPHETTADQFFSEAQFEAYRALGEHIGDDLFQPELIPAGKKLTLEHWFGGLVETLMRNR